MRSFGVVVDIPIYHTRIYGIEVLHENCLIDITHSRLIPRVCLAFFLQTLNCPECDTSIISLQKIISPHFCTFFWVPLCFPRFGFCWVKTCVSVPHSLAALLSLASPDKTGVLGETGRYLEWETSHKDTLVLIVSILWVSPKWWLCAVWKEWTEAQNGDGVFCFFTNCHNVDPETKMSQDLPLGAVSPRPGGFFERGWGVAKMKAARPLAFEA